MKYIFLVLIVTIVGVSMAHGQESRPAVEFGIAEHPGVRIGDAVTLDLLGRFDLTSVDSDGRDDEPGVEIERRRIGVSGAIFDVIAFEVERELEDTDEPWRDAWVGVRPAKAWLARAGKFKVPFSRARTTSLAKHAFVNRPLAADALAPGRQVGVGVEGELFDKVLGVEGGWFREAASSAAIAADGQREGTPIAAVRVGARVFRPWLRPLRNVEIAVAATVGQRPESLDGVAGRSYSGEMTFFPEVYVNGRRLRTGVEVSWSGGAVDLAGEYLRVADERREQGIRGDDLSELVADGWHGSAVWRVFGARRERDRPMGFAPFEGSAGTLELVGRIEALGFHSASSTGTALRNPRAAHLVRNTDHAVTFGGNWHFSRFGRLQCNAVGERIEDVLRSPVGSDRRFWTVVTRLQLHL
jgi:phosphate-selective porin